MDIKADFAALTLQTRTLDSGTEYEFRVLIRNGDSMESGRVSPGLVSTLPGDADSDGVTDDVDNCLLAANPDQTDGDADFNNDCVVNAIDFGLMRQGFFSTNAILDLSADGVVNAIDLGLLRTLFFSTPGPSGLSDVCD